MENAFNEPCRKKTTATILIGPSWSAEPEHLQETLSMLSPLLDDLSEKTRGITFKKGVLLSCQKELGCGKDFSFNLLYHTPTARLYCWKLLASDIDDYAHAIPMFSLMEQIISRFPEARFYVTEDRELYCFCFAPKETVIDEPHLAAQHFRSFLSLLEENCN